MIARALAKDPADRFDRATNLATAARTALAGGGGAGPAPGPLLLPVLPASAAQQLRSDRSSDETFIRFVNRRRLPVQVHWIDWEGDRVQYRELAPGEEYLQQTYTGHPWVVVESDVDVAVFLPAATLARAVIAPA